MNPQPYQIFNSVNTVVFYSKYFEDRMFKGLEELSDSLKEELPKKDENMNQETQVGTSNNFFDMLAL